MNSEWKSKIRQVRTRKSREEHEELLKSWCQPVLDSQTGDVLKILHVVCHQSQIVERAVTPINRSRLGAGLPASSKPGAPHRICDQSALSHQERTHRRVGPATIASAWVARLRVTSKYRVHQPSALRRTAGRCIGETCLSPSQLALGEPNMCRYRVRSSRLDLRPTDLALLPTPFQVFFQTLRIV